MTQLDVRKTEPAPGGRRPPLRLAGLPASRAGKWVTLGIWVLVALGSGVLAPRVFSSQSNATASQLPSGSQSAEVNALEQNLPGHRGEQAVVVAYRTGGLRPGDLSRLTSLQHSVLVDGSAGQVPVQSLTVAPNHTVALFSVSLTASGSARVHDVAVIRDIVGEGSGGLDIKVTGQAAYDADENGLFSGLDSTLLVAAAGIVAVLLLAMYRSPLLWLVPLVCVGLADFAAQALVYLLIQAGLQVNSQTLGIQTVLVFGVGTDYALLIVARYREELHQHADHHEAMRAALRGAAPAVVASGGTVAVSLLCLLTSVLPTDRSMGPVAAVGVVVAVVAMLTALPAVLVVSGRRIFWPYAPRFDRAEPAWEAVADEAVREADEELAARGDAAIPLEALRAAPAQLRSHLRRPHLHRPHLHRPHLPHGLHLGPPSLNGERRDTAWVKVGRIVLSRSRLIAVLSLVALGAMCCGLIGVRMSLPASGMFRGSVDSARGQALLDKGFPPGTGVPLDVVVRPPTRATAARAAAVATPGIASVGMISRFGDLATFEAVMSAQDDSPQGNLTVARLREHLAASVGPSALVGGQAAMDADTAAASTRDFRVIVPLVLLVVLLVLALLLRAVVAPLMLLATVVLSFAAALGVSRLVFASPLFRFSALDTSLPLFAFIFLVALGCDYNIFLMARVREEARHLPTRVAVVRALAATGGVITSAGVVLAGTFLVLDILPVVILAEIGFVVAFGVLLDTFVVRTVLVPALSINLGPRLWWPGWLWRWERDESALQRSSSSIGSTID